MHTYAHLLSTRMPMRGTPRLSLSSPSALRPPPSVLRLLTSDLRPPTSVLFLLSALLLSPGFSEAALNAQTVDFSHYQPILDRMPFGQLPSNFGQVAADPVQVQTEAQVQAEKEKLAKQVTMSCVNVTPSGKVAIGFTDLSDKAPVNLYLLVGDSGGGWTVLDANYDEEWAQIKKGEVTITLKLGQGLIEAPPTHGKPAVAKAAAQPAPPPADQPAAQPAPVAPPADNVVIPGLIRRPPAAGASVLPSGLAARMEELQKKRADLAKLREAGGDPTSYTERLREREAREMAEKAASEKATSEKMRSLAEKVTQDALEKKERELSLRLLEQGDRPVSATEQPPEEEQPADKAVPQQ